MPDCVFCGIVEGTEPSERVYADEHAVAFLDIAQATPGHTLLVPRQHCESIYDIGPERAAAVMRAALETAAILRTALEPEGMNLLHASGRVAWQSVFHFHLHLVPRYRIDELALPWRPRAVPRERLAEVAARIRVAR